MRLPRFRLPAPVAQPHNPNNTVSAQNPYVNSNAVPDSQSLSVNNDTLGFFNSPLQFGMDYDRITGFFVNAQYAQGINENTAFALLGELGSKRYRVGATAGVKLFNSTLAKLSYEYLSEILPFDFNSGDIHTRLGQNAVGLQLQHNINFANLNGGGYYSKAPNKSLDPVTYISDGGNCGGYAAGLECINYRNIAGGTATGGNIGLDWSVLRYTNLNGNLYYDHVTYDTEFTSDSKYDASGIGASLKVEQLVSDRAKLFAEAEVRKIYDSYTGGVSWIPTQNNPLNAEISLVAQEYISHNSTPNSIGAAIQFTLFNAEKHSFLNDFGRTKSLDNLERWVKIPAIYMKRVLATAEERIVLAPTTILNTSPSFGPISGGNTVVINGQNFLPGAVVLFGDQNARVIGVSPTQISVIAPPFASPAMVNVTVKNPGQPPVVLRNGYTYLNVGQNLPQIDSLSPNTGSVAGGTTVMITGQNIAGASGVTFGGNPGTDIVPIDNNTISVVTPEHAAGTVDVVLTTPEGSTSLINGFNYLANSIITQITPNIGPVTGGTPVTITGQNLGGTLAVIIGGVPATNVIVQNSTTVTAVTSPHAAGTVNVVILAQTNSSLLINAFTYQGAPTLGNVSPATGTVAGGEQITLTGTNLTGTTGVTFGGVPVPNFTIVNSTTVTVTAPPHAAGLVDVVITTPIGSSTLPNAYTYLEAPSLTGITPTVGPITGATNVTLTGNNLLGTTAVTFGGIAATSFLVVNNTTLTAVTPAHAAGAVDVVVTTLNSTTLPNGFTYQGAPTLGSVTPSSGSVAGGTTVTLTGTNLTGTTGVTFGGVPATIISTTDTTVTVSTPVHTAGVVDVVVTTPIGSATLVGGYTYADAPTLSGITPNVGPTAGSGPITLSGTNLTGTTSVTFGGITAGGLTVVNDTTVTVNSPPHSAGVVDVVITTPGGIGTLTNGFTYQSAPTVTNLLPSSGSVAGGTVVTITGTNFSGTTTVTFDGVAGTLSNVTSTSVTVVTPAHVAGVVDVALTTPVGTVTLTNAYTYVNAPILTGIAPNSGSFTGGTSVTLTGTNFTGIPSVTFGGTPATNVVVVNSTTVTATTPAHAAGAVDVVLTTSGGNASLPNGFTFIGAPTVSLISPNAGSIAGGTVVTITGTNLSQTSAVTFGNINATIITADATTVTVTTPAHAAGLVDVVLTTPSGSITVTNGYTYNVQPALTSISPITGSTTGGTTVTLTGSNLLGTTGVTFDGIPATAVIPINDTTVTATTPAHSVGPVNVVITTPAGSATLTNGFTYQTAPTLSSILPTTGTINGGTLVTIAGTNLIGTTSVTLGGSPATNIQVDISGTSLTAITPAHAAGAVNVVVTTPIGSATLTNGYTYAAVPTLVSASPTIGSTSGGTTVTLTGTNLTGTTGVTFGGTSAPGFAVVNSTTVTVTTPAHAAGLVDIVITTPIGSGTLTNGFTYQAAPTLTAIAPTTGSVAGGTFVTLTGVNLTNTTGITFDGIPATGVQFVNDTSITAFTPAHSAGAVDVVITTPIGSSTLVGGFTYAAAPILTGIAPSVGPIVGGITVTLTGTSLTGTTGVTFDGIVATNVTNVNATTVTALIPAHAAGVVDVVITTPIGSATLVNGFTYQGAPTLSSLSPTIGSVAGGTLVTLIGTNLTGATGVTFDGVAGSIQSSTDTTVTVFSPPHAAGLVDVVVTTPFGNATLTNAFTYAAAPTLTNLSPTVGPISGGTTVTLIGTNLSATTGVTFDGVPASFTILNSTTVTATTPSHAAGVVDVAITTPIGSATLVGAFTYQGLPTLTSILPAAGTIAGGTAVTLTGTNLTGTTGVTMGGVPVTSFVFVNATTVTAVTPAHAAGIVDVVITTPIGSATLTGGYTYAAAPSLGSITPVIGPLIGGTVVTLTGTSLSGTTGVTFGGVAVTSLTILNSTTVEVTTPAHSAGAVDVTITTPIGSATLVGAFTYQGSPTLISLSPTLGSVAGGTTVTLTGTNLLGASSVTFGGTAATNVVPVNATTVTVTTPAHIAGTVNVSVTTPIGSATLNNSYTYAGSPSIASISPNLGPVAGGQSVTITGTNFVGSPTVTLGGTAATSVVVVNATSITAITPAHSAGAVNVVVTTPINAGTLTNGYTYTQVPNITSCGYSGALAWLCVGTNMNAFVTPFIHVQGGLLCGLAVGISSLTTTLQTLTQLGGATLPLLYQGCQISICANSTCAGVESNVVVFG